MVMNRLIPSLCILCKAPLAKQEEKCWKCGTPYNIRSSKGNS